MAERVLTKNFILGKTRLDNVANVKNLNFWGQELQDVSVIEEMPNVEVVSLSVNNINTLKPFEHCYKLRELYLRKNKIAHLSEIHFLKDLKALRVLWLAGNPCADCENYRLKVIAYLDGLTKLDDDDISPEERELSKQFQGMDFATDAPRRSPSPKVKSKSPPKIAKNEEEEQAMVTKPRHKLARTPPKKDVPKLNDPIAVTESANVVSNRRLHNDNTPVGGGNVSRNESPIAQRESPVSNAVLVQQPSKSVPSPQPSPVESDFVVHAKQEVQKNQQQEEYEEEEPSVVVKRDATRQPHDPYVRMQREGHGNNSPPPQQESNKRHAPQQQHISVQQSYQGLPQHYQQQQQHYMEQPQLHQAHRQHSGRDMGGYNQNYQHQNLDYGTHQRVYEDNPNTYLDNAMGHNNYSHPMNSRVSTAQQGQRSRWEVSQVSNIPYFPSSGADNYPPQQPSRVSRYNQQQGYQKSQPLQLPQVNRNTLLNVVLDLVNELDPERLIVVRQEIDKILMNQ
ncbi:hypothetical protein C9374_014068 [Naegleria lovaniensis]|uniref:Uncharacterized protein n=1 Tax=Naegleria lovaniensis TaxID=51637 RepID=A0AA88GZY2_NAELO|nr:uncharacterized protein C9374_014068 [Naegleria lovaniensis]KAG2389508.1 hypothetical protein C9374_014068 [Naegleria lovaniensis]